jgi:hypothetical protein
MMRKAIDALIVRTEASIRRHPRLHLGAKRALAHFPMFRERMRRRAIEAAHEPTDDYGADALSERAREILSLLLHTRASANDG